MTAVDTLTRKLMDLGATTEMIVLVVEWSVTAIRDSHKASQPSRVTKVFVTPDELRTANRMRKRKQRDNERIQRLAAKGAEANDAAAASVTVRNVTCDNRDMSQAAPTSFLPSFTEPPKQKPSEEGSKHRKKDSSEKARGSRMQAGAVLTDEARAAAIDLGAHPDAVPGMWAEFVDFWIGIPGQRGCKSDWPATWRNRVRTIAAKGKRNGHATSAVGSAFDDLIARAEGRGGEGGFDPADDVTIISPQGR